MLPVEAAAAELVRLALAVDGDGEGFHRLEKLPSLGDKVRCDKCPTKQPRHPPPPQHHETHTLTNIDT